MRFDVRARRLSVSRPIASRVKGDQSKGNPTTGYAFAALNMVVSGADDHETLLDYLSISIGPIGRVDPGLTELAQQFEGAYPYLRLIAGANGVSVPIDPRVAEASWLTTSLEMGAKLHHNSHVFDIYRRAGLMRDGHATVALDRMDGCRTGWGRVVELEGAEDIEPGNTVSIHWDWICERLSAEKLRCLSANTRRAISNTNATL